MFDEHYHSLHTFFVPWVLLVLSEVQVIIRNEGREIRIAVPRETETCRRPDSPAGHLSSRCSYFCQCLMIRA